MWTPKSQNVEARFCDWEYHSAAAVGEKAVRELDDAELPRVVGGANMLAASAGDGPVPFEFNPWYSPTYARFAIRTGAPL
jgi:hypothetical protein